MAVAGLDPAIVCGLITERGEQARAGTYERRWERDAAVWKAVVESLGAAGEGHVPAAPRADPPSWLASTTRTRLEAMATRWSHRSSFDVIRTLERLGLVGFDADDTYVLAVVGGLGDRFPH